MLNVLFLVQIILKDVADEPAPKCKVRSGPYGRVNIGLAGRAGETRVHMYELGAAFHGSGYPTE